MGVPIKAGKGQSGMNVFERYLTVWVFLCIVAGIALGQFFPAAFQFVGLPVIRARGSLQCLSLSLVRDFQQDSVVAPAQF